MTLHLNRQQVILAHREATDTHEEAMGKRKKCSIKNRCNLKPKPCVKCPAYQAYENAKRVLDEKTEDLRALNKQVVKQNEELSMREFHDRKIARAQGRIQPRKSIPNTTFKRVKQTAPPVIKQTTKKEGILSPMTKLTRSDLTVEKYIAHKMARLSDQKIGEMYNFPLNAFNNWKKTNEVVDKLAVAKAKHELEHAPPPSTPTTVELVEPPPVVTSEAQAAENVVVPPDDSVSGGREVPEDTPSASEQLLQEKFARLEAQYAAVVQDNENLGKQLVSAQNKLSVSEEMNRSRNEMIAILENEIHEMNGRNVHADDSPLCDYKSLYADSESARQELIHERDRYKKEAEELAACIDKLKAETNAQFSFFRSYESGLLERLLGEIQHNRA